MTFFWTSAAAGTSLAGFEVTANGGFSMSAQGSGARRTRPVPAVAPAGKLTFCLTTGPAPKNVSVAVTLTASSTARGDYFIVRRFARLRAGPRSGSATDRSLPRVFRSPSPNHGERMIGKRYMQGCTKILGPARKKSSRRGADKTWVAVRRGWFRTGQWSGCS